MQEPALRMFEPKETFAGWLLGQTKREGWIGNFALAAKADGTFPRNGDVEAVKKWLSSKRADGDDRAALDDAETDWLCI